MYFQMCPPFGSQHHLRRDFHEDAGNAFSHLSNVWQAFSNNWNYWGCWQCVVKPVYNKPTFFHLMLLLHIKAMVSPACPPVGTLTSQGILFGKLRMHSYVCSASCGIFPPSDFIAAGCTFSRLSNSSPQFSPKVILCVWVGMLVLNSHTWTLAIRILGPNRFIVIPEHAFSLLSTSWHLDLSRDFIGDSGKSFIQSCSSWWPCSQRVILLGMQPMHASSCPPGGRIFPPSFFLKGMRWMLSHLPPQGGGIFKTNAFIGNAGNALSHL